MTIMEKVSVEKRSFGNFTEGT